MATPAQLAANRSNAQSSTGPRSVEGKAVSSRNSLKLGLNAASLIPGEDPADLEQLTAHYQDEFHPATIVEEHLVQTLVRAVWMQLRCDRLEAAFLNSQIAAQPETSTHPLGAALADDARHGDVLTKIFRRRQAAAREWSKNIQVLAEIQTARFRQEQAVKTAAARPAQPPSPSPNRVRSSIPVPSTEDIRKMSDEDFLNMTLRL